MHFSIPTSKDLSDNKETFTIYNLQINGVYHCSFRYSQLHNFNTKLKKEFDNAILSTFPSKKLLSLSFTQKENRRIELEKYIQNISQVPEIVSSDTFIKFFLKAQKESQQEQDQRVELEVLVPGSQNVIVSFGSTQQTMLVYQEVANKMELPKIYRPYFGLFLVHHEANRQFKIIRRLQGFESPYISLKCTKVPQGSVSISVRKIYWNVDNDKELINDKATLNILVSLTQSDLHNGWVKCNKEEKEQLKSLLNQGYKKRFMKMAWTLPYYGHIFTEKSYTDFPSANTPVIVSMGGSEVRFIYENNERDIKFKVTRIRCWRISSIPKERGEDVLELSMEYLMDKDTLKWINVFSKQAILISMCLQSMVDELIMEKNGQTLAMSKKNSETKGKQVTLNRLNEIDFEDQKYFSQNNAFNEINDDDL